MELCCVYVEYSDRDEIRDDCYAVYKRGTVYTVSLLFQFDYVTHTHTLSLREDVSCFILRWSKGSTSPHSRRASERESVHVSVRSCIIVVLVSVRVRTTVRRRSSCVLYLRTVV